MMMRKSFAGFLLCLFAVAAKAQIPTTDLILNGQTAAGLAAQAASWASQYQQMVQQYKQLQQAYAAVTGGRGMELLASQSYGQRNYLPDTYSALMGARGSSAYAQANAVLSTAEMANLSPAQRASVEAARQAAAVAQMASQAGYENASAGFRRVQSLIDAISRATDAKGIGDLQARMAGEQIMVATEQNKLVALRQATEANRYVEEQQRRERAMQGIGDIRSVPTVRYWQ